MTGTAQRAALAHVLTPAIRDLGDGFEVRRALPSVECRTVGPFVFFDQMGPAVFGAGKGLDVRPHPHIGLATVTYLFEGEILHRDSLGTVQPIRPGEVNWMTAGRGITHSERTPPYLRGEDGSRLFGIQTWVALPKDREETQPAFAHHGAAALPSIEGEGKCVRLVLGDLHGAQSPVSVFSKTFYADAALSARARLDMPADVEERAIYVACGKVEIGGRAFDAGQLLVFRPGGEVVISALEAARLMLFGGEPLDGPRHLWWNFVSSSAERIKQAKEDWQAGRFAAVPGDPEYIPLPEGRAEPVRYP